MGYGPMAALEEPSAEVSASDFRQAMGHFATGVTVVTSVDEEGDPVGTTASAVSSLSLDPPLVLVCFDLGSLTLRGVRRAGAWDGVRPRPGPTGSPRLDGVLAVLECTVENSLPGGDHEIVVGRVHDVEVAYGEAAPLLYWRGSYLPAGGGPRPAVAATGQVRAALVKPGSRVSSQRRCASRSRVCGASARSVRPACA